MKSTAFAQLPRLGDSTATITRLLGEPSAERVNGLGVMRHFVCSGHRIAVLFEREIATAMHCFYASDDLIPFQLQNRWCRNPRVRSLLQYLREAGTPLAIRRNGSVAGPATIGGL